MRQLLEQIQPQHWDSQKPAAGSGFHRVRLLQSISDLFSRPVTNRATVSTNATAINCNGTAQSTGVGIIAIQPKRYAELTVKARVTFNLNAVGSAFVYMVRTLGQIPANGAPLNVGDVFVGGDAFVGGPNQGNANYSGAFSYLDTGLDISKSYRYYLAVSGTNGAVLNLVNLSQFLVMERS